MISLNEYLTLIVDSPDEEMKQLIGADQASFYERFICFYLQQLNEKIDRIREHAGRNLQKFFKYTVPKLVHIDFHMKDHLTALFIQNDPSLIEEDLRPENAGIDLLPWRSARFVFDSMKPLYDSEVYSLAILKGLITSSGGLTESTVKASSNSLFEYLSEMSKSDKSAGITTKLRFL